MRRILAAVDAYREGIEERGSENAQRLLGFVLLLRYTGMRIGDVTRLTSAQIQGKRLFLYTQKTGVAVNTILPQTVLHALELTPRVTEKHYFWDGKQQIEIAIGSWRRRLAKLFELAKVDSAHPTDSATHSQLNSYCQASPLNAYRFCLDTKAYESLRNTTRLGCDLAKSNSKRT